MVLVAWWAGCLVAHSAACGADEAASGGILVPPDAFGPDLGVPRGFVDGGSGEGDTSDAGPEGTSDASGDGAGPEATAAAGPTGKPDDAFLIPPTVATRSDLTLGPDHAAWVRRDAAGPPQLMIWNLEEDGPPEALTIPNLMAPRQLVLGTGWLFYVDDRYGDADVFAVRLLDRFPVSVVTQPGDQDAPAARGATVAWRDCRACVATGDPAGAEIYRRTMDGSAEQRLTFDETAEGRPALGSLADGTLAVAWAEGPSTIAVLADATLTTETVPGPVARVALTEGALAWREDPFIINPDSMMPSDVFLRTLGGDAGSQIALTTHGELEPGLDGGPVAAGGHIAWLVSEPGASIARQIQVATAEGTVVETASAAGMDAPVLGGDRLGFLAPRDDNDGLVDVWILQL